MHIVPKLLIKKWASHDLFYHDLGYEGFQGEAGKPGRVSYIK